MTTPTVYEWAGGAEALRRLTEVFYDKVLADPVLAPLFAHMSDQHREHVAIWLICWSEDHDTGFHDHDRSAGAVAVASGAVREDRLRLGAAPSTRVARAGESFTFAASTVFESTSRRRFDGLCFFPVAVWITNASGAVCLASAFQSVSVSRRAGVR